MKGVLLDTHTWAWVLTGNARLPARAGRMIEEGAVFISPVSFFEIGQKVRLRKWPEMESSLPRLFDLLTERGGQALPVSPEIALLAAGLDWPHRDPFDRILAASAILERLPLVSADAAFDGLVERSDWPGRVW